MQTLPDDPYKSEWMQLWGLYQPCDAPHANPRVLNLCGQGYNFPPAPAPAGGLRRSFALRGLANQQSLHDLSGAAFLEWFPSDKYGGLQHIRNHINHPCPRVAEATTVHQLTVAVLAEAFLVLAKSFRTMGYHMLFSTWAAGRFRAPEFLGTNQLQCWESMTVTERAALLLFSNPPTKTHAAAQATDREVCLTVCKPGHRR